MSGTVGAIGTLGAMLVEGRALNCENDDLRGIVPMNTGTDTLRFDPKPLVSHVNWGICLLILSHCLEKYLYFIFDLYVGTSG